MNSDQNAKPAPVTRRNWLKMAGTAVVGTAALGGVAWLNRDRLRYFQAGDADRYLRTHFDYLDLQVSEEEMEAFFAAYSEHYGRTYRASVHGRLGRRPKEFYTKQLDQLATTFLLSTDFFLNGGDEAKPVKYVMLYHPYASPCWNPLSLAARAAESSSNPAT